MDPIIIRLGPFTLRWYGLMYAFALLAGLGIFYRMSRRNSLNLSLEQVIDFMLVMFVSGLIGARLYYVLFNLRFFFSHPLRILGFGLPAGEFGISGLAIHGGLIGGGLAYIMFVRWKGLPHWRVADAVVPAVALGQVFGRVGNFFNGDAYGFPTKLPWGVKFPASTAAGQTYPGQALHPTMLYEGILNLLIFVVLIRLSRRSYKPGFLTSVYFILYAVARSVASFWRADSLWIGPLRAAHLLSAITLIVFSGLLFGRKLYSER
ncbi:MAG: prolipoprotein diacylglyceryl transferase [Candidatus Bipolaricaulota bacterium]